MRIVGFRLRQAAGSAAVLLLAAACGDDDSSMVSLRIDQYEAGGGAPAVDGPMLLDEQEALSRAEESAAFEFAVPRDYPDDLRLAQVIVTVQAEPLPAAMRRSVGLVLARDPGFDDAGELTDLPSKVFDIEVRSPALDLPETENGDVTLVDVAGVDTGRVAVRLASGADTAYSWSIGGTGYVMTYASPTIAGSVPRVDVLAMIESMAED